MNETIGIINYSTDKDLISVHVQSESGITARKSQ